MLYCDLDCISENTFYQTLRWADAEIFVGVADGILLVQVIQGGGCSTTPSLQQQEETIGYIHHSSNLFMLRAY